MTLTPTFLPVRGVKGKPNPMPDQCSAPGCYQRAQQAHHLYPRSHVKVDYDWVELPDERVISNRVGLCVSHHADVTGGVGGHRARIDWGKGVFYWALWPEGVLVGPLDPQPLASEKEPAEAHPHAAHLARSHVHLAEGQTCGTCGYTRPAKREPGPKRKALTWGVSVPADAELGADVLDGWVEQFAAVMGLEGTKGLVRYHVLATVLAWADQHLPEFINDVKEAGES